MGRTRHILIAALAVLALLPASAVSAPAPAESILQQTIPGMPADAAIASVPVRELLPKNAALDTMISADALRVSGRSWNADESFVVQAAFTTEQPEFAEGLVQGVSDRAGTPRPLPASGGAKAYIWRNLADTGFRADEVVVARDGNVATFEIIPPGTLSDAEITKLVAAQVALMPGGTTGETSAERKTIADLLFNLAMLAAAIWLVGLIVRQLQLRRA